MYVLSIVNIRLTFNSNFSLVLENVKPYSYQYFLRVTANRGKLIILIQWGLLWANSYT